MHMLTRHRLFLRCVSLLTAITFLPSSVQAWHFFPAPSPVAIAGGVDFDLSALLGLESRLRSGAHAHDSDPPIPLRLAQADSDSAEPADDLNGAPRPAEAGEIGSQNPALAAALPVLPESPQLPVDPTTRLTKTDGAGIAGTLNLAATPSTQATEGLRALPRETLEGAIGGPRQTGTVTDEGKLPKASEILSILNSTTAASTTTPAPVLVAQAGGDPPVPGAEAEAALADAAALKAAGNYSASIMAYVEVMEDYPDDPAAVKQADRGIVGFVKDIKAGTLTRDHLAEFETALETWAPANGQGAYGAVTYLGRRSEEEWSAGNIDVARDYALRNMAVAERAVVEFPHHYKQMGIVDDYLVCAERLPATERDAAAENLRAIVETLPPSIGRLSGWFALANFEATARNNRGMMVIYRGNLLQEAGASYIQEIFADPNVEPWLKGMLGHAIGGAYWSLGYPNEAIAYYESILEYMSDAGSTRAHVELSLAHTKAELYVNDHAQAAEQYTNYLARFPDTKHTPKALIHLAGVFMTAGDYAGAADLYSEVVQRWPESGEGRLAGAELDYIQANLLESAPVAALSPLTEEEQALAMRCGPEALARMLAAEGIEASVDELAQLAGTSATGTSMLGLMAAAGAKGLKLAGVQANSIDELIPPYIAYINGDHFILVDAVDGESVTAIDNSHGVRSMSRGEFAAQWNGMVLVSGAVDGTSLEVAALQAARGGNGTGGSNRQEECKPKGCNKCEGDGPPGRRCPGGVVSNRGPGPANVQFPESDPFAPDRGCGTGPSPRIPGSMDSPEADAGFSGFGVSAEINTFTTALELDELDLSLDTLDAWGLYFGRTYRSDHGYHRAETVSTAKWFQNNIGSGWAHNLNIHLTTSGGATPATVLFWDQGGAARTYAYDSTSGGYDWYFPGGTANPNEFGNVLKRDTTTKKFTLEYGNGDAIEFSAATTSGDYVARAEYLVDYAGNTQTFIYDDADVAIGKLTKVQSPAGDAQHLAFTYSGNLITKVELKANTVVLNSVSFTYNGSDELIEVEDHAAKTVEYAYGTDGSATGSRFITKVTNKRGIETDLAWTFGLNASAQYEAYKIQVDNADGLTTVYERGISTSVCTITNWDTTTLLSKFVNTPVTGNLTLSRYKDYYLDATNYERWGYEYDGDGNLIRVAAPGDVDYAEYTYNSVGHVLTKQFGTGPIVEYEYDGSGQRITKLIDAAGIETDYTYDGDGLVELVEHPSVHANGYQYDYDANGQLIEEISPLGTITEYTYDAFGQLIEVVRDMGGLDITTLYDYDDYGNMIEMTDPRGKVTEYEYGDPSCGACGGGGNLELVRDALNRETEWVYDTDGLLETTIDAAGIETDYTYDDMGRLTTIEYPAGSTITSTITYNKLGQVVSRTDFGGSTVTYAYGHMGRTIEVTDAVGDVDYGYNVFGLLATVTDSLDQVTTNTYDTAFRLVKVTDDIGKETHYTYDAAGRQESVGAGATGTVDPTTYAYDVTTGLLDSVEYTSSSFTANYEYDGEARLVKLTDWLDAVDGLRYAYDDVGRLTTITDYDDSTLTYTYDDAGNVLTMTDYHGNVTSYTYNDIGQLATLTAPGSKVWTYTYDTGNRLSRVDIPNGMHTEYAYDTHGRQDAIHHKDDSTVVQGFDYTFENGGNITRIDHEDGSYWEYDYDGRDRLIEAIRGNKATPTIEATYEYTYDDGDNMLTKVTPWFDDFQDGNFTGWSGDTTNFSVTDGVLENTLDASVFRNLYLTETDADHDLRFDYTRYTASGTAICILRYTDSSNQLYLEITPTIIYLRQRDGGTLTTLDSFSTTVAQNTNYSVRAIADGAVVSVYWGEQGGSFEEILTTASCTELTTTRAAWLRVGPNSEHGFDNIQLIADGRSTTQTFTHNDANEQITSTVNGVTTTMTYDAWGRMVERDDTTHTATYGYRYGSKLYSVASDFPGEGNVSYETGGDMKRRSRVAGADETWYNYTIGFDVVSTEDDADGSTGALTMTNIVVAPTAPVSTTLGDLAGTTPSTGTARYYTTDHLGSTRSAWDASKAAVGAYEFTPYGSEYNHTGAALASLAGAYTGKPWDATAEFFHFPYRQYSPDMARWTKRDPLGMVDGPNVYAYVMGNPIGSLDQLGGSRVDWWNTGCKLACTLAILGAIVASGGVSGVAVLICAAEIFAICMLACLPVGSTDEE